MKKHTRRILRNPMACITMRMPLANDQTTDLGLAYHMSLQAMLSGHGTEQTWSTLSCSLNVALVLAEGGNGNCIETIKLAQDALMRSRARANSTSKWAFDGDAIRNIEAAINIHDEQISRATKSQVSAALHEVHRRIEQNEVFA